MSVPPVLRVDHLVLRLEGGRHLQDISFVLSPGEVMGILGPLEAGKTALLGALAGLVRSEPGRITICGHHPGEPFTRSLVGYVPSSPALYEEFTCVEYLGFFAEAYGLDAHYRPYLIREALRLVRLEDHLNTTIADLRAYGMRRRLGVARALVHDPHLLVMDDCLSRLERGEARLMVEILGDIRNTGKTLVLATSALGELASLCSHLCVLVGHRPLACGQVRALLPVIANLRMMQVQVLENMPEAVRRLEQDPRVHHLLQNLPNYNLLRFLFDGTPSQFDALLESLRACGVSIVSYAEDPSFLGRVVAP